VSAGINKTFALPPRPSGSRLPDFLLIGAMKAGTTTLSEWLRQHPGLYLCRPKEPQFFSRAESAERGWDWYSGLFADAGPDQLVGEASTCYSRWPHFGEVAGRLAEHVPEARLIFLARHPVERAYSHYRHEMQRLVARGEEPLSFEAALEQDPEIVDASLYAVQLDRFREHYADDQILLLLTEDLDEHAEETWRRVQAFLAVDQLPVPKQAKQRANEFGDYIAKRAMEGRLTEARQNPLFRGLRRVAPAGLRAAARRFLIHPRASRRLLRDQLDTGKATVSPLSEATRAELLSRFKETTRAIEQQLGRDLASWRR
jgi:hypothetical protein